MKRQQTVEAHPAPSPLGCGATPYPYGQFLLSSSPDQGSAFWGSLLNL
ncbi:MAG: hypothetical protein Q6L68_04920 [Thermostichus sp. DG02_5_bins_236]